MRSIEDVMSDVVEFVAEYETKFGRPVSLAIISQKYNKIVMKHGLDVRRAVKGDPRLFLILSSKGHYSVSTIKEVTANAVIMELLKECGGNDTVAGLRARYGRLGRNMDEFDSTLTFMSEVNVLKLESSPDDVTKTVVSLLIDPNELI